MSWTSNTCKLCLVCGIVQLVFSYPLALLVSSVGAEGVKLALVC